MGKNIIKTNDNQTLKIRGVFRYNGIDFKVNITDKYLRSFNGNDYWLNPSGNGQVVRQVLNQMKKLDMVYFDKVYIKTKIYSGGNSLRCYVVGSNEKDYQTIRKFIDFMMYGNFNGMIDLYEYNDNPPQLVLKNNTILDIGCKYTFTHKGFPYGTQGYFQTRNYYG